MWRVTAEAIESGDFTSPCPSQCGHGEVFIRTRAGGAVGHERVAFYPRIVGRKGFELECARVVVIHHGQLLFDGQLSELVQRFSPHKTIVVELENGQGDLAGEHVGLHVSG